MAANDRPNHNSDTLPTPQQTIVYNPSRHLQRTPKIVIDEASRPKSVHIWIAEYEAFCAMKDGQFVSQVLRYS